MNLSWKWGVTYTTDTKERIYRISPLLTLFSLSREVSFHLGTLSSRIGDVPPLNLVTNSLVVYLYVYVFYIDFVCYTTCLNIHVALIIRLTHYFINRGPKSEKRKGFQLGIISKLIIEHSGITKDNNIILHILLNLQQIKTPITWIKNTVSGKKSVCIKSYLN